MDDVDKDYLRDSQKSYYLKNYYRIKCRRLEKSLEKKKEDVRKLKEIIKQNEVKKVPKVRKVKHKKYKRLRRLKRIVV